MLGLLFAVIGAAAQSVKETCTTTVPAENWANKELYYKDIMDGVPVEQRMKNLKKGKYKLSPEELNKKKKSVNNNNNGYHRYTL